MTKFNRYRIELHQVAPEGPADARYFVNDVEVTDTVYSDIMATDQFYMDVESHQKDMLRE